MIVLDAFSVFLFFGGERLSDSQDFLRDQWATRIQKYSQFILNPEIQSVLSLSLEEDDVVVSELASGFALMFYVLLSWASMNKTPEAHLLHLRHFKRLLNKALSPQRELPHNTFMDFKTDICSDCMDLCAWGKKGLMDVIYSKHVRLIILFIDGNNLLIIEIHFHLIIYTHYKFLWWSSAQFY